MLSEQVMDFNNDLISFVKNKTVIIVGFGREGISTYKLLRSLLPDKHITISDKNPINNSLFAENDRNIKIITGENYLDSLIAYDIIIKSPGISFKHIDYSAFKNQITSQADLFLKFLNKRIVGITGTKGKSTTATLIYDILKQKYDARLVGNIGIPFFDNVDNISENTIFIAEFSANQLQFTDSSPRYSILLNIYPEHLDHFEDFEEYQSAKKNIFKYQNVDAYSLINFDEMIDLPKGQAKTNTIFITEKDIDKDNYAFIKNGKMFGFNYNNKKHQFLFQNTNETHFVNHFKYSILCAISIAKLFNIEDNIINNIVNNFKGLEHRLEFVGTFEGKKFYNDSICTIPEAAIKAIKTISDAQTIIIGGFDRGIEYTQLIEFIAKSQIQNIVLVPDVGMRISKELIEKKQAQQTVVYVNEFEEAVIKAIELTDTNKSCLLSPAAASYNNFKNFEERGLKFKQIIYNYFKAETNRGYL